MADPVFSTRDDLANWLAQQQSPYGVNYLSQQYPTYQSISGLPGVKASPNIVAGQNGAPDQNMGWQVDVGGGDGYSYYGGYNPDGTLKGWEYKAQPTRDWWEAIGPALPFLGPLAAQFGPAAMNQLGGMFSGLSTPQMSSILSKVGPTGVKALLGLASGTGGKGMDLGSLISGGASIYGGMDLMDRLRELGLTQKDAYTQAGKDARADYQTLADRLFNQRVEWGTNAANDYAGQGQYLRGLFGDLGATGATRLRELSDASVPAFETLRDRYTPQYQDLADQIKESTGEFKPYNITTNIGKGNKDTFTLGPGMQNISDQAAKLSGNAFGEAAGMDLGNLRQEEFDLMQQLLGPVNQQKRVANEERLRKQGRLDVAGGQGYNPQTYALEQAIAQGDLQALLQADDNAMRRLQGLSGVGTQAAQTPLAFGQEGRASLQLGSALGDTEFENALRGTQAWAPYAQKAIDYSSGADWKALDFVNNLQRAAVDFQNQQEGQGIKSLDPYLMRGKDQQYSFYDKGLTDFGRLGEKGIEAQYNGLAKGLQQQFNSESEALDALTNMYSALSGKAQGMFAGTTFKDVESAVKGIVDLFKTGGMTEEQAVEYINAIVNGSDLQDVFDLGTDLNGLFGGGVDLGEFL